MGKTVWIISDDSVLSDKIAGLLGPLAGTVNRFSLHELKQALNGKEERNAPDLVILDVDQEIEEGAGAVQHLKRARIRAPLILFAKEFTQEFGAKLVSQGARYYFSHDFCSGEFLEVAGSLLRQRSRSAHSVRDI